MNYKILMKVQEQQEEYKDTWKHIKDLEAELEFLLTREPNESKYIASVKDQIDKLYKQIEIINGKVNKKDSL